jgi:hypothetical protein
MSRRVTGVSGRLAGGSEYSASRTVAQQRHRRGRDVTRLARVALGDEVVAELVRLGRHVLLAHHRRPVAGAAQRVQ